MAVAKMDAEHRTACITPGHESVATTERYVAVDDSKMRADDLR